jgi:flagellar FliJ protein
MSSAFPLAGLLRLRRLEEDQAAARFGAATARLASLVSRQSRTVADAGQIAAEIDSLPALRAVAAARVSSMSMLAELHVLAAGAESERQAAEREFGEARGRTLGLEKLEDRHASTVAALELAAEQTVLDELGSSAHHRAGAEGAAP